MRANVYFINRTWNWIKKMGCLCHFKYRRMRRTCVQVSSFRRKTKHKNKPILFFFNKPWDNSLYTERSEYVVGCYLFACFIQKLKMIPKWEYDSYYTNNQIKTNRYSFWHGRFLNKLCEIILLFIEVWGRQMKIFP